MMYERKNQQKVSSRVPPRLEAKTTAGWLVCGPEMVPEMNHIGSVSREGGLGQALNKRNASRLGSCAYLSDLCSRIDIFLDSLEDSTVPFEKSAVDTTATTVEGGMRL